MYADIILPLAVEGCYSYEIPEESQSEVIVGVRVVVPLGPRKFYTGIVYRIHDVRPNFKTVKSISSVVDKEPVVTVSQVKFWEWLSSYYMCSIGEVMKAALPSALKSAGYCDAISESYTVKKETYVSLSETLDTDDKLKETLNSLKRAKNQYSLFLKLIESDRAMSKREIKDNESVKNLEKKGFVQLFEKEVSRNKLYENELANLPQLTPNQQLSLDSIKEHQVTKKSTLLHGVTGSGKTEIYIHLISETLTKGSDVLYLLPEIALTSQLIERLQNYFGDSVIVYHSRFNDNIRAECYMKLLKQDRDPILVLGVRSSLLLPYEPLGLIIIDEEHENTYKQYDPAPRYHARDSAIMLAHICGAVTLMGSATPSVETYFNAVTGKYGCVTLNERYTGVEMPRVIVSDTIRAAKRGEKISHFSTLLINKITEAITNNKQIILFQNRRGFSPYVECSECATIQSCPHCNVSLTYHKSTQSLVCHYCGYTISMPEKCPCCGVDAIKPMGFGTEKVEEELQKILPQARIARLDIDTARSSRGLSRVISEFAAGRIDVLVGTQMVSKGFDFGNVSLVGILNADNMLNFPDFRAGERSYQLMIQVAGRAGRRDIQGEVILQTSQPRNPVISQIVSYDYDAMFRTQIAERQRFLYPPFCRMIQFTFKHSQKFMLDDAACRFEHLMRHVFGTRLLGPEPPAIDKIRNEYLCGFILKIEREKSFAEAKKLVLDVLKEMNKTHPNVVISIDVDPQ